ncbi:MAG: TIGR00289 family protein [Candidatus Thermoplasmatota archaeon]
MRVAVLLSGGKDSVYACYTVLQYGWEVSYLVNIKPLVDDSYMFHSVNTHLVNIIAESIGINLLQGESRGEKKEELNDLKHLLMQCSNIDGVVSGAIASEYQRTCIERICHDLGIRSFTPLWHKNQYNLLKEQVTTGLKIMIVGVSAQGFDETWLGRIIDENCIRDLSELHRRYKVSVSGEGGEYETLVLDAPIFKKRIFIDDMIKEWSRDHGLLRVTKTHLEEKKKNSPSL